MTAARVDGWDKITGRARFLDDIHVDGAWIAGVVRAGVPRAHVRSVGFDPSFDWSRVVRITASDLGVDNVVRIIAEDMPILAAAEVSHAAEALCLVAAPDRGMLARAMGAVHADLEPLDAVADLEDALACRTVIRGNDNTLCSCRVSCGDAAGVLASAPIVVEGTYRTGHQEHAYLEPSGVVAIPGGRSIEIVGSLQCPYYVQSALERVLPGLRFRVRQSEIGGAFGGKEDYPSVIALQAALLALKAGRPVRLSLDRHEDMVATTKRHPSRIFHRTAVDRDGAILAMQVDAILDGGAYVTLSPVVLQRAVLHSTGAYRCQHVDVRGRVVATSTPPNGAFRGFGAPQAIFAVERQIDLVARTLGLSPLEVRRRNVLRPGDRMPCGQMLDAPAASEVLERAVAESGYEKLRARKPSGRPARGVGLSLFLHGGGFTGGGEARIGGTAAISLARGRAEVLVSSTEMGQGARTVLPIIAARALGWPPERVSMPLADTSIAPDTGPTVASRTTMVVGRIVEDAARRLESRIREHLASIHSLGASEISIREGVYVDSGGRKLATIDQACESLGPVRQEARYSPPEGHSFDDATMKGDAYLDYAWGADVVEIEVDTETWEVRPIRLTLAHDVGRAVHPVLAAGQMEGGSLQGLGWACMEQIRTARCRYLEDRMSTYIVPTAADAPEFSTVIVESPGRFGPGGAKGLGELPVGGVPPAYASAIEHATGLIAAELPITPEKLFHLGSSTGRRG